MPLQSILRREVLRATVRTTQWCHSRTPAPRFTVVLTQTTSSRNVTVLKEFLETNSLDELTEMHGLVLDIVGPALATAMPPWYFDLANAMRAHMTMSGGMVPTCAVSTYSSSDSLNAFVNVHVSYVVHSVAPTGCQQARHYRRPHRGHCGDRVSCPRQ